MKTFMVLLFLALTTSLYADYSCTAVIRDQYGFNYDEYTAVKETSNSACIEALFKCDVDLSYYTSMGSFYDAECVVKNVTSL